MPKPDRKRPTTKYGRLLRWLKMHAGHNLTATIPPGGIWCNSHPDDVNRYFDTEIGRPR